jgi:hypothetical protein
MASLIMGIKIRFTAKPGISCASTNVFSKCFPAKATHCLESFLRGLQALNAFNKLHQWNWIHKVHPCNLLWAVSLPQQFS